MNPRHTITWPPERFVWAVIDSQGWQRSGPLPDGFRAGLQELCPAPLEGHHAVCVPLPNDTASLQPARLLVCTAPTYELSGLPEHIESLTPTHAPAGILPDVLGDAERIALASRLNLLVGPMEPRPVRERRFKWHAVLAALTVVCSVVVAIGLVRRQQHWRAVESAARTSLEALAREMHAAPSIRADQLPAALEARAQTAARLARTARAAEVPRDATEGLAGMLTAWPLRPEARLLGLTAGGDHASLSIAVQGDPAPLLNDLRSPAGWTMAEPRISTSGVVTRLSIALTRSPTNPSTDSPTDPPAPSPTKPLARSTP